MPRAQRSPSRSSRLLIALALLGVGIVAGIFVWRGDSASNPSGASADDPGSSAGGVASASTGGGTSSRRGAGRPFVPGEQSVYRILIDQDIAFQQTTQAAGGKPATTQSAGPRLHMRLTGDWQVTVVDANDEEAHVEVRLLKPELLMATEGRDNIDPNTRQRLLTALGLPHFAAFDASGALKTVYFAPECDTLSRGFLRLALGETQFVVRDLRSAEWETQEFDTTGRYVAVYQKQTDDDHFRKQKRRYLQINTAQGLAPPPPNVVPKLESDYQFTLGSDRWPNELRGQQRLEVETGVGFPTVNTRLEVSLTRTARQRDSSRIGRFASERARLQAEAPYAGSALAVNEREQDLRTLDGANLAQLLAAAASLPEGKENEEKRNHIVAVLLEKLRALLRLEPGQAQAAVQAARTAADPRVADLLIGALEAASTPESIHGLGELARDQGLGHELRMHATAALGLAERPTGDAIAALRDVAREADPELRSTASLAIGNAGHNFQKDNPTTAQSVVDELKSALRSASSPDEQAVLIRALGNTGSAEALAPIAEALKSPLLILREAAVEALRLIPSPDADKLIASILLGDPQTPVRRSAVFASGFRDPATSLPVLAQAARSEQTTGVRSDIIHVVGRFGTQTPGVVEILTWISQNDADTELRNAAAAYLKPAQ